MSGSQSDLLDALAGAGALGPQPVERIDTHLSTILLAGDRAFKAMRAVRYDFVDHRSPNARRAACFAEVAGNPMAGDLYRGVRAVLRAADGGLRLGPLRAVDDGSDRDALEHLVELRRFDRAEEFDRLLLAGRLTDRDILALADLLATSQARAKRRAAGAAATRRTLDAVAATLSEQTDRWADDALRAASDAWRAASLEAWNTVAPRLDARSRHGRVRRCHGDLHLGNVVRLDGAPRPFDAITFNDALGDIDTLYDAAFTAMDLRRLGGARPARLFLDRLLSASRDYSGLRALPLFVSLRAAIRAMTSLLGDEPDAARQFLALANDTLAPSPGSAPRLVAVGGGSGVGKSTLAAGLQEAAGRWGGDGALGPVWLRSDVIRKRLIGIAPETTAPAEAYDEAVSQQVLVRMARDTGRALRAGISVIVDATFLGPDWRAAVTRAAAQSHARFDGLWLAAPDILRVARAEGRAEERATRSDASGATDPSDAGPAIAAAQSATAPEEAGWRIVSAEGAPDAVLEAAIAALTVDDRETV